MNLREALLILGNEEDGPGGVTVPQDAIDGLLERGLLYKGGPKSVNLTERGEEVFRRAKAGTPTTELD